MSEDWRKKIEKGEVPLHEISDENKIKRVKKVKWPKGLSEAVAKRDRRLRGER